jgi:uncharacterized protein with HEPN domain
MLPDPRVWLEDIRSAADLVGQFTKNLTLDEYKVDELRRSATERQFEIMGEALNRLQKAEPTLAAQVPNHRRIIAFRNRLIHGYDVIDDVIVWDIIQRDLPGLIQQVERLLAALTRP